MVKSLQAQIATIEAITIDPRYQTVKRVLDITLILLILLPLCLIMAIVVICIRLDSEGPVLFRQKRVGQNGLEFEMLKFRSMYVNSDDSLHRETIVHYLRGQKVNGDTTGFSYKRVDDPRITKVGRFIRKTSLDEFPQFFNVLRGEMSLVGPRPSLPYEVEQYQAYHRLRLCGKPGITGIWQIYGRSRVTFQKMVEMDIAYLQQQTLWEDVKLIALTIPVILQGRGGA
ncbi:MAG: sugar transferase [Chloroflexota bacterium]|nr:sugar transferase [Chloroflexota bacterium]